MKTYATPEAVYDAATSIDPDGYDGGSPVDPWDGSAILDPWGGFIDGDRLRA